MRLSTNFDDAELVASDTARRLGIDNAPSDAHVAALRALCQRTLQPLRDVVGRPVRVISGYRSPELLAALIDEAKRSGGPMPSRASQHLKGEAADVVVDGLTPRELACLVYGLHQGGVLQVDQCIHYGNGSAVHVSYTAGRVSRGDYRYSPSSGEYLSWRP